MALHRLYQAWSLYLSNCTTWSPRQSNNSGVSSSWTIVPPCSWSSTRCHGSCLHADIIEMRKNGSKLTSRQITKIIQGAAAMVTPNQRTNLIHLVYVNRWQACLHFLESLAFIALYVAKFCCILCSVKADCVNWCLVLIDSQSLTSYNKKVFTSSGPYRESNRIIFWQACSEHGQSIHVVAAQPNDVKMSALSDSLVCSTQFGCLWQVLANRMQCWFSWATVPCCTLYGIMKENWGKVS